MLERNTYQYKGIKCEEINLGGAVVYVVEEVHLGLGGD